MLSDLNNLSGVLQQAGDQPVQAWRFSPRFQSEENNLLLWREIQNMRYKKDGSREDLFFRGGTVQLNQADATIVQIRELTLTIEAQTDQYLFVKDQAGKIYIYSTHDLLNAADPESVDPLFTEEIPSSAGTHSFDLHTFGPFLYLFDGHNNVYKYIDLKKLEIYNWLAAQPPQISTDGFVLVDDDDGDIEENIFGFRKNAPVLICPKSNALNTVAGSSLFEGEVYLYTFNGGKYMVVDGREYRSSGFYTFDNRSFTEGGSGDDFTLQLVSQTYNENNKPTWKPIKGSVRFFGSKSGLDALLQVDHRLPVEKIQFGGNTAYILPDTPDLENLLETLGPYKAGNTSIEETPDYEIPLLWRSYVAVYELNDGSYTMPSVAAHLSVPADEILGGASDLELNIRGLKFSISGTPPGNARRLLLFATRFQLSEDDCFRVDDRYPNGPYFFAGSYDPDITEIKNFTPDRRLLDEMSAYLSMSAGIPEQIAANQLKPVHATSFKNAVLYSNYTITPGDSADFIDFTPASGAPNVSDRKYRFQVVFTNGQTLPVSQFDGWASADVQLKNINAFVQAVRVFLVVEDSGETIYNIREITSDDPAFYGKRFRVNVVITGLEEADIDTSDEIDSSGIQLPGSVVPAFPPQNINIANQQVLPEAGQITGVNITELDPDRAAQVRYRTIFFTDARPLVGLLTSTLQEGRLSFLVDTEPVARNLPLKTKNSILSWGNGVLFQSTKGIYYIEGRSAEPLLDIDEYPELENPVSNIVYHTREDEVWVVFRERMAIILPSGSEELFAPRPYIYRWGSGVVKLFDLYAASPASGTMMIGLSTSLLLTDTPQALTDAGFGSSEIDIDAELLSDHIGPFLSQLRLQTISLYGIGYTAKVQADLQVKRFDNAASPQDWSPHFTADTETAEIEISQQGTPLALFARGINPRLKLKLQNSEGGRLSAVELQATPLPHKSANRS